jgi:hypothetical protein
MNQEDKKRIKRWKFLKKIERIKAIKQYISTLDIKTCCKECKKLYK